MRDAQRSDTLAKSRVDGGVREVVSGIDALYLSGWVTLQRSILDRLKERKEVAEGTDEPIPFEFGGEPFKILGRAWKRYRFCIEHPNGQLGFSPSAKLPPLRIQPRAIFLHGVGATKATEWFEEVLQRELGDVRLTVSRADLFADWQGWSLGGEDRHRFVCRAGTLNTYESWFELNGLVFGKREGGGISARIYDKTAEIAIKPAGSWWLDVWGGRATPNEPVHRVEFEVGRQALRQFAIDGPRQLIESSGALWAYLTDNWLSLRVPTADTTRSRWPVAPEWEPIRLASLRGSSVDLERLRATQHAQNVWQLMPGVCGCLTSVGALTDCKGLHGTLSKVAELMRVHEQRTGVAFADRLATKRRRVE